MVSNPLLPSLTEPYKLQNKSLDTLHLTGSGRDRGIRKGGRVYWIITSLFRIAWN